MSDRHLTGGHLDTTSVVPNFALDELEDWVKEQLRAALCKPVNPLAQHATLDPITLHKVRAKINHIRTKEEGSL